MQQARQGFLWPQIWLGFAIAMATTTSARAHEWYPWECCSNDDCAPISASDTPHEERGGFRLSDGRHVPYQSLRPSPDGQWHLCEQKWPAEVGRRRILCVYAPHGGA
jgi:hypothetical protein